MKSPEAFAGEWAWPERSLTVLGDLHAHPKVLAESLALVPEPDEELVLLGDLLDKGPTNLGLLDAVGELLQSRQTTLLLGNHDLRFLLALEQLEHGDRASRAYFATRLGLKGLVLAREIYAARGGPEPSLAEDEARKRLEPKPGWSKKVLSDLPWLTRSGRIRERDRLARKHAQLREALQGEFTWRHFHEALHLARDWFLDPEGRYAWLARASVCLRRGSFFFVHAGLDDSGAKALQEEGVEAFGSSIAKDRRKHPWELYFGPVGRALRTKYGDHDPRLGSSGRKALKKLGIRALVTGHRPCAGAPKLAVHDKVLHLEAHAAPGKACALRILPGGRLELLDPERREEIEVESWGWSVQGKEHA